MRSAELSDLGISSSDSEELDSRDETLYAIKKVIEDTLPKELGVASSPNFGVDTMTNISYRVGKTNAHHVGDDGMNDQLVEDSIHRKSKRRKTGVRGRPKAIDYGFGKSTTHKLSPEASNLMGKGNTAFVKRDYSTAINYFLEVIKLSPKSPEPYRTLATAYQEIHEYPKTFGYLMIAAHISNNDSKLWLEVASIAQKLDKKLEAIYSLEMAIRTETHVSLEVNDQLAALFLTMNQPLKAVKCYSKYLTTPLRDNSCAVDESVFQKIAQMALDYDVVEGCCEYFEKLILKYIQKLPLSAVWSPINLYLELLIQSKNYLKILESIQLYASSSSPVSFSGNFNDDTERDPIHSMPEEIFTKYAVSLLMTNQDSKVDYERLCNLDPAIYADLKSTAALAYYEKRKYSEALEILFPLQDFNISTEIRVKIGYCQKNLNDYHSAADTFNLILLEDPSREDARIALADIYQQLGRRQEALSLMETGRIIRQRRREAASVDYADDDELAEDSSDEDIYNEEGAIISFHRPKRKDQKPVKKRRRRIRQSYSKEECENLVNLFNRFFLLVANESLQRLSTQLQTDLIQTAGSIWRIAIDNTLLFPKDSKVKFVDDESFLCGLSSEKWIDFFLTHIIMLEQLGRSDLALRAAKATLRGNLGKCDPLHSKVKITVLAIHLKKKNLKEAADCFRFLWTEERDDLVPLFFSVICPNPAEGSKALSGVNFFRAINRFSLKKPKFLNLKCLLGHLYALSGSFEEAARSYRLASEIATTPEEKACVDLFLYNALCQRTMQRTCRKPREYLVEAFAFLFRYLKTVEQQIPSRQAEAYFNVGRAYHGLGMFGAALKYYKKSLQTDMQFYPSLYNSNLICKLHF